MLVLGLRSLLRLNAGAEFPDEAAELARDADLDLVVMKLSLAEHLEAMTQASLGFPGELPDPPCNPFLPG